MRSDSEQKLMKGDERKVSLSSFWLEAPFLISTFAELLVDVTSHELRQPVSAILNCSQLVRTNLSNLAEALRKSRAAAPFVPTDSLLKQIEDDLDVRFLQPLT